MRLAFACLLPLALSAQPQTTAKDLCTIEGRIVNVLTGEPLKKAVLSLRNLNPKPPETLRTTYTTVSGHDGRFAMTDIEPGSYNLSAERTGFLRASYGARHASQRGATLSLSRGQTMKDVNFQLIPHGVVSGHVVDEDGDPVQQAQVHLLRLTYVRGRKQLQGMFRGPGMTTNDLGEYRIFGLQPGKYALAATAYSRTGDTIDHSMNPRDNENYVPTYYPGTIDVNAAILIDVMAGAEARGIDVRLVKAHAVTVKGHVTNQALPGRHTIMVNLIPANSAKTALGGLSHSADASGRFEFRGVVPGAYRLHANVSEGEHFFDTEQPVQVPDEGIDNVNVTISAGVELLLHVTSDSGVDWEGLGFDLSPTESDGGYYSGPVKQEDQIFRFESVSAGHYYLHGNLPEGYFIKSARSGDVDVLTAGLKIANDPPAPLEVVLSPNSGQIAGMVENPETQQPAAFSIVTLVPQEKERLDQPGFYQTATADQSGSFTLKNLTPGEYRLYAWDEIEDGAYTDPDFLKPFESKAQALSVKEGDRLSEQIAVILTAPHSVAANGPVQ